MLVKLLFFDFSITNFNFFFSFLYTLSKICIFLKFIIFHFFSYISGSDLESSEKLLTLQEMRLFYLMLKKLLFFFQQNTQGFSFLHFFISPFFFFHVFVSSDVFIVDFICSLHCFFTVCQVLRFCVVNPGATDLRKSFSLSGIFYIALLSAFIKTSLEPAVLP